MKTTVLVTLKAGAEIQHQGFVENESFKSISVSRLQTNLPIGKGSTWDVSKSLPILYAFLPPKPRAWTLCETYLQHGAWSGNVVTRSEIIDDIMTPIYKHVELHTGDTEAGTPVAHHKLATLFLGSCMCCDFHSDLNYSFPSLRSWNAPRSHCSAL